MRIGIVTGEYPPMQGGVGAYTRILAGELAKQASEVAVFSSKGAQSTDHTNLVSVTNNINKWDIWSLLAIREWVHSHKIDILNIQFQTAAYGMSPWIHLMPQVVNVPTVTTFHDLRHPYLFPKAGSLRDAVVMHLAKHSNGVICTNHEDDQRLNSIPSRVLIPIGSNIQAALPVGFSPDEWRRRVGVSEDEFLIGYFGLFNQTKGIEVLLEAVSLLRKLGHPLKLIMIGGGLGTADPTNAAYLDGLHQQAMRLGLKEVIHWTGYLEHEADVGAYLSASNLIVLPFKDGASFRRGSLMAAIQYGCPIITTIPSVEISSFRDMGNMMLVRPDNTQALTEGIDMLITNEGMRIHLKQGATALRDEFRWETIAAKTLAFFDQVRAH